MQLLEPAFLQAAGAYFTGSVVVGALAGILAGMLMSAVLAALTLGLAVSIRWRPASR